MTEDVTEGRRKKGLNVDDEGRRKRGKYDGPKIDNYDKFCKYRKQLNLHTFPIILMLI